MVGSTGNPAVRASAEIAAGAAARCASCASGVSLLSLMSHARPRARNAEMPYQFMSISYHASPCFAATGTAWWLLCQPSPKVRIATQKLLVEVSVVMKRREPHMWVAEFTNQVECRPSTVRRKTAQSITDKPPKASVMTASVVMGTQWYLLIHI